MRTLNDISSNLQRDELQMVEIVLSEGEKVIADSSSIMYMEQGIVHEEVEEMTIGDRAIWIFYNQDTVDRKVVFSDLHSGEVLTIDLRRHSNHIICHSNAFLCSAKEVSINKTFFKNFGKGLYEGEFLSMENLIGNGHVYLNTVGSAIEKSLEEGEVLRVDSRRLVALTANMDFDIQMIGDNLEESNEPNRFFTSLLGPGRVWLQTATV